MKAVLGLLALGAVGLGVYLLLTTQRLPQPSPEGLSYALSLARLDPLLVLAGSDVEALQSAVERLQEAQEELAALQLPNDAEHIRARLYPIAFLRSLAALEEARRDFLSSGTAESSVHYDSMLEKAIRALGKDLAAFKQGFELAVPATTSPYQVPSGTVSRASMLRGIEELQNNAEALARTHERRQQCIYESLAGCEMPQENDLLPSVSPADPPTALPALVAEVRSIRAALLEDASLGSAPVVMLNHSACLSALPSPHYFLAREQSEGPLAPPLEFWGDILLQPLSPEPKGPVVQYLFERGARYYPPSPVAFYQCPEIGSDLGRVFSTVDIYEALGAATSSVLSEEEALQLVHDAMQEGDPEATELALAAKNRSAHFDKLVMEIAAFGHNDAAMKRAGVPIDITALYLLYVKSGFPSLYLGYNPSAQDGGTVSIFESQDAPELWERLVQWSALRGSISQEELLQHMRAFFTMHDDPEASVRAGAQ